MTLRMRTVAVMQLPEISSVKQGRTFLHEIQDCMDVDRPRMVLDCSNVRRLNRSVLFLLLRCLEEALKCKGDIKLAAVPPGTGEILELTGIDRLFDIYDTAAEAVNSFRRFSAGAVAQTHVPARSYREPENVA